MIRNNLQNAYLHITESCEHKCAFCYASHGLGNFGHADIEKLKKIVLIIADAGIKKISLVGGDPALHPQIGELLEFISDKTEMKTVLMTNTGRFPGNAIKELAPYIDVLMTTIHGDSASQHDKITTIKGSYTDIVDACKEYQANHVKVEIAFNITPTTHNMIIRSVDALLDQGINIHRLILQRIAPVTDKEGNIIKLNKEYVPNAIQVNIALSQMETIVKDYCIPVELVDPFPLCIVEKKYQYLITPCKCGWSDISINGNGDTTRCGANPNYILGNILSPSTDADNPIRKIWMSSIILKDFRERAYLPKVCQDCEVKLLCGGGCEISCNVFSTYDRNHLEIFNTK